VSKSRSDFGLASFHQAAGEAGFPAFRRVPRAFGEVLGLGAGATTNHACNCGEQQKQGCAPVVAESFHEAEGLAGMTESPSRTSPSCQPGRTLAMH